MPVKRQTKQSDSVKKEDSSVPVNQDTVVSQNVATNQAQENFVAASVLAKESEAQPMSLPVAPPVVPVTVNRAPAKPSMGEGNSNYNRPINKRPTRPNMGNRQQNASDRGGNNYNNGYSNYSNSYTNANSQNSFNPNYQNLNVDASNYTGDVIAISGLLEILPDYGVIRQENHPYDNIDLPKDVYISQSQIRRFALRPGDAVTGFARPPKEGERYLSLLRVEKVDGMDPEEARKRPYFTKLTPIFPNKWLRLETTSDILSTRLIDLVSPIGKGQRAMIVAPPKAGKTWLLKDVANGITTNFPDVVLLVALIGERPEEVTHFSRSVKGEVFASNFDEKADEQTRMAEICLERAKRMAEKGKDVVILMDSLTRLARAYNMVAPPSGRTLTGGFDPAALYPAKHFFGAARNLEEGGSLTIIATALVDTGSRMDDVIFEEFKGTGNMELRLDRSLAERRIYPAIDIKSSSTRHDEYLLDKSELERVFRLRRMVDLLDERDATELVMDRLKKAKSNKEFLENLNKA